MMNVYLEFIIAFHIVVGSFFVLVGSFGLIRLSDLMSRLHGPSKATTLGLGGCLVSSIIYFGVTEARISIQELLITLFIFITTPVTAHFIAKAHLHTQTDAPASLPPTGGKYGWSTFDSIEESPARPATEGAADAQRRKPAQS